MHCNNKLLIAVFSSLCLLLAANTTLADPSPPDAGAIQRDLQPGIQAPEPSPDFRFQGDDLQQKTAPGGMQVTLKQIELSGNSSFSENELLAVLGDYQNQSYDLAGLHYLAHRISSFYRDNGYPFARAYLPAQEMQDGQLQIGILEGRYGAVRATGEDHLIDPVQNFISNLSTGDVIKSNSIERTTLLLDDLPGIKALPVMRPGQNTGEGDLEIRIEPQPRASGSLSADNHGNRYSGAYRTQATININRLLHFSDELSLSALYTDQHMWFGQFDYSMLLGNSGLRGNLGYGRTSYDLGKEFDSLDAIGTSDTANLGLTYPVLRSQSANIRLGISYQHKDLRDEIAGTETRSATSHTVPLRLSFDVRDGLFGGAITYGTLSWTHGNLLIDNGLQRAIDDQTAKIRGSYRRINIDMARVQRLCDNFSAFMRIAGQRGSKNLYSSEDFNIGGAQGVRAYPQNEASDDHGYLVQLELRYRIAKYYEPYVLYDYARVTFNDETWSGYTGDNHRRLSGAGIGMRYARGDWSANVSAAWRMAGGQPESVDRDPRPRILANIIFRF